MQPALGGSGSYLRSAFVCGTLATLGCGANGSRVDPCASYALHKDLYAYCVSTRVVAYQDPLAAKQYCDQAGEPWRSSCRTAWVERAISDSSLPVQQLLFFCETDDCRLQVLDGRPEADLLLQMKACDVAGKYAEDCRGHAAQRWSAQGPEFSEVQRIATGTRAWPELRSDAIGTALGCLGLEDCSLAPVPERCIVAKGKALADYRSCVKKKLPLRTEELQEAPSEWLEQDSLKTGSQL